MPDRGARVALNELPSDDREVLSLWARGSSRRALRARIVLARAEPGATDTRVAAILGVSQPTVACWRRRYAQAGMAGLGDAARSGRPKAALELTGTERTQLATWARQSRTGQTLALRAKIVLACAAGAGNRDTAARLNVTEATVGRWRQRFIAERLDGLPDRRRPGRPPAIPAQKIRQVINETEQPPRHAARWSQAAMARRTGLSPSTVGRIWVRSGLRPHLADAPAAAPSPVETTSQAWTEPNQLLTNLSDATARGERLPDDPPSPACDHAQPAGQALLAAERRDLLIARLARDGKLIAKDLAAEFGLSDDSIRRDLRDLATAGLCQRVYGGALPVSPALGPHASRSEVAPDSKRRVGAAAARLITPGSTVILDGGTTAVQVVMALPPDLEATIITHSATTAAAAANHPKVTVRMLGGQLNKQSLNASGAVAAEEASTIAADLALLTVPGVHPHEGLTTKGPEDAAMKRILAGRAAATYIMASIEKLGTVSTCKVTGLSEVTGIITDAPGHPTVRELDAQGTAIISATP